MSDARHFKQEVTSRVYDNAFKICISAREFHDPAARMRNPSVSRRSVARKTGSRSSRAPFETGNKPEVASGIPRNLRSLWKMQCDIMRSRGANFKTRISNNTGQYVTCRYDRFLKRCSKCDTRQTFVRGKVKLVGGKKRGEGGLEVDKLRRF